ncbi:hypothetical protein HS99_0001780 [Kitasatospora aureofaciens]|uniref:UspA domain-containing protein n=1 Tax=Kitasatospora aureofaciens TaxID=1894 RepID=A0A1E7NFK2_KITAU|nr:hypothetical protein HS99_0001780 [Kitasatospora aureofaciens]
MVVLAAVDGSPERLAAARWTADEAVWRRCHRTRASDRVDAPPSADSRKDPGRRGRSRSTASAAALRRFCWTRACSWSDPVATGLWGRLALGSTSTEIVHHAHLPVVVPGEPPA